MSTENSMIVESEGETLQAKTLNCNYPVKLPPSDDQEEGDEWAYREVATELTLPRSLQGVISFSAKSTLETQRLISQKSQMLLVLFMSLLYAAIIAMLLGRGSGLYDTQDFCDRVSTPLLILSLMVLLYDQRNVFPWNRRRYLEELSLLLRCGVISKEDKLRVFDRRASGALDYQIVGSAGDCVGYFSSQIVNNSLIMQSNVMLQDADVNIFINSVTLNRHNIYREGLRDGFTRLTFTEEEAERLEDPIVRAHLEQKDGRLLLNAKTFVRQTIKIFREVVKTSPGEWIEEKLPAFTWHTWQYGPNGKQQFEVDYAFAFNYFHWPQVAEEWVHRETTGMRYGLDQKTVNNISRRGCYIVPRQSGEDKEVIDWRFTFTAAESDLFHYHKDKEALVLAYIILKHVLKMKGRDCSAVRSYHLKTIFFWMAEQPTELDYYTTKGNSTLDKVFMEVVTRYIKHLEDCSLPNYFIPSRNMLWKFVDRQPCTSWRRWIPFVEHEECKSCDYNFGLRALKEIQKDMSMSIRGEFEVRFWKVQYGDIVISCAMMSACLVFAFYYLGSYGEQRPAPTSAWPCDMCGMKALSLCKEQWKGYFLYGESWPNSECIRITAAYVVMSVTIVAFCIMVLAFLWLVVNVCLSPFRSLRGAKMGKSKESVSDQQEANKGE